jgi:hypothetical protein
VKAFRQGVNAALAECPDAEVIACFHDDLEITHAGDWVARVLRHFDEHRACGLAGFGGALGLGSDDLYKVPYEPTQLARQGFRSNLVDATAHGGRSLFPERVACLDGFSQIGRREFWEGRDGRTGDAPKTWMERPWDKLDQLGMVHHFYDGALGCLAKRYGWETWYLPIACQHHGGRTAVGDAGYHAWAATQVAHGDQGFWQEAHRLGYDEFKDVLPLRV